MALRFSKMKGFILGFQRFVWWPKWTPASRSSVINSVDIKRRAGCVGQKKNGQEGYANSYLNATGKFAIFGSENQGAAKVARCHIHGRLRSATTFQPRKSPRICHEA